MEPPETRYARSGDVHIGYQVIGDGPFDLVLLEQWFSNIDALWQLAPMARFVERLARFSRVILLDKRGTGISDPVPLGRLPTLEEWMDDIRVVMDEVGSRQAALVSAVGACYLTIVFAATYPERTRALVLVDGYARITSAPDYFPDLLPRAMIEAGVGQIRDAWGQGGMLRSFAPAEYRNASVARQYGWYERQSASPAAAFAIGRVMYESDVRQVLPVIRVPTLVITHAESARIPPVLGRYVADHIPGARHVSVPGSQNFLWAGDQGPLLNELEEFLTGVRPAPESERILATVLFTDIVKSTERARIMGDQAWRELLARHFEIAREQLARFRGHQVVTTGDGLLATFDGPARAVRCAQSINNLVRDIGLEVRAGLHTGEIEIEGSDVRGIAVHIGSRIAGLAQAGEVLVSSTVKDLVVGSGIEFLDRGTHELKGIADSWHLYSVSA